VEKWGGDLVLTGIDLDKYIKTQNTNYKAQTKHNSQNTNCQSIFSEPKIHKSRYFLKVQDGCRQFCSYCIIPYARGELKSRPVSEVLAEADVVARSGCKEIVLCGIHLGQYGIDLKLQDTRNKKQINLDSLLKILIEISGIERIRLSSIEINEVTDELIELMKKERKLCRQLHIPLQSGCDKILKLMNRPYATKMFAEKIKKIRKVMPEIAITTDVIVGFPGETEKDFQATTEFIKQINFSSLHIFPFSAHEKTPAAAMPEQVAEPIKNKRVKKLNDLSGFLEKAYIKRFAGKPLEVIVDGRNQGAKLRGRTDYNFDIEFSSDKKYRQGELVKVGDWELL
jgi:threonylcarbamoyladenosine tRNA methylthiotransferase MtaB